VSFWKSFGGLPPWRKTRPVRNDLMWASLHELASLPQWASLLVYVECLRDERMSSMLMDRADRDALAERASELNDLLLTICS
jgi:hypothetical protein